LNIDSSLEENFLNLSKENHIAILIEDNSLNKRIVNFLKKMEIDVFYL